MERNWAEIVTLGGKVAGVLEFRHGFEAAVEGEPSTVVTASQKPLVSRAFAHLHAAVGADVGNAVEIVVEVSSQQERLVEETRQEIEWIDLTGDFDKVDVANKLPTFGENLVL